MKNSSGQWRPILTGDLFKAAVISLEGISAGLARSSEAWLPRFGTKQEKDIFRISLSDGYAGLSVYFAYIFNSADTRKRSRALLLLNKAIDALGSLPASPSLYEGFAGIAWAATHLQGVLKMDAKEDLCMTIDAALTDLMKKSGCSRCYDLINGLVGFGVYFLERLPRASAKEGLFLIAQRLNEMAIKQGGNVTWHTDPLYLPPPFRDRHRQGYRNLGMAHGIAGIISLLSILHSNGIGANDTESMLEGAVSWILSQESVETAGPVYPSWITPDGNRSGQRYGWCYGDMCIVFALLRAGRCLGNEAWRKRAIGLAHRVAEESLKGAAQKWITDPFFCHGSCGLAHQFNRLYQATGDTLFLESAIIWYEETLGQRREGQGVGGYPSAYSDKAGNNLWPQNPGILNGAGGVGMVLLAGISDQEPLWDRMFLLDIPCAHS